MKRRNFLKRFTQVAAVAAVAPVALSQLSKVTEPIVFENSPHIIRGRFEWNDSEMQNVQWVETPNGNMWYFQEQVEAQRRFEDEIELQWMKEWENKEKVKNLTTLWDSKLH